MATAMSCLVRGDIVDVLIAILGGSVGAAVVAGMFSLFKWRLDRKAALEDREVAEDRADCAARGEDLKRIETRVDGLYAAMRMQMYNDIKARGKACISHKCITSEELEDLTNMHKCYHDDLGGNGFLDTLMKQVRHLPIVGE